MSKYMPIVFGMLGIVVCILFFPIVLDTTATITAENLTPYTGLEQIVALTPLLIWVVAIFGSVFGIGYGGYKAIKGK